jgi:hypothetical protein
MSELVRQMAGSVSRRKFLGKLALAAFVPVAVAAGAPVAAASAKRRSESPDSCAEFCSPAGTCHGGCGCSGGTPNCFICNGCNDVNKKRCFSDPCSSGFCWKPVC